MTPRSDGPAQAVVVGLLLLFGATHRHLGTHGHAQQFPTFGRPQVSTVIAHGVSARGCVAFCSQLGMALVPLFCQV